ncbi:MAG: FHA domain-containing protein, partial [Gemmatimonadaceae bacterium]
RLSMTSAFAILLTCVAVAAALAALIAFIWVNKTPNADERFDEYGRVPLFGVDVGNATATRLDARRVADEQITPANDELRVAQLEGATPVSTSAIDVNGEPGPVTNGVHTSPSNGAISHTSNGAAPPPQRRLGGDGWGARPGWPTPPSAAAPIANRAFVSDQSATNGAGVNSNGVPGSMIEGHALRFSVPAEGTLQFLPGRLEISSGLDAGREIRFVRVPGPNGTEITFGRNEGPLYRHIQLRDQTVSREHARMTLVEGTWQLANLSRTNPVAHNGRVLGYGEQNLLEDGDRVEMGEVVFSFRSR